MTKTIKIKVLVPGQIVSINGHGERAFVIAREQKGLYTVRLGEHRILCNRNQLSVLVHNGGGRWSCYSTAPNNCPVAFAPGH